MSCSYQDDTAPAEGSNSVVVITESTTESFEKASSDNRGYRVIRLANNLEALIVHDPDTDKASAALDVNVGSFSDEVDMPGMAHAVEHTMFLGTKEFPAENGYRQYLAANSGSSDAYTGSTSTNYSFNIAAKPANDADPTESNPSPFREALGRFAQFFIEPLFLSNALDRELKAVDSENKKNLQNDVWRLHQLDKSLSNPNHPYCHFSTGNLEVLKTLPEARGINTRDKFIEFYAKHYSANRMKLVVLGREPLDVMQKWVVELFSPVVNKGLAQNRWSDEVPFRQSELGVQVFAKPIMDFRELNLDFPFIDEEFLYSCSPSQYISHLIGHKGPGSIMSCIKAKGWADGLSVGAYPICPGTPAIFRVQVRLTEEGLLNYTEIIKIFFQYTALLRESPPLGWIFQELKGMADINFKFEQKAPASCFTTRISSVMQEPLPRELLLRGRSYLRDFEPQQIEKAIGTIRPDNLRIGVVSRSFPGNWDQKEKWYGTEYRSEPISDNMMAEFKEAATVTPDQRLPSLHLPHKNKFIPNQLEVEKKDVAEPGPAPRLLRNDFRARTWWKKDGVFCVPKANVVVSLRTPIISASAENNAKTRLFTDLVRDALEKSSDGAGLAGLQYQVSHDNRGLLIEMRGFNQSLPVLLEQVVTTMRDVEIKEDRFGIIKERLTRVYSNFQLQSPHHRVGDYTRWLNSDAQNYIIEQLALELPTITVEAVREFQEKLLSRVYVETYVHGNMCKKDAHKVTDMVLSTLNPRILPQEQWPIRRSLLLPPGSNYVFKKTLEDPQNVNHCIETCFSFGDRGDRDIRSQAQLVAQMIHEPAFDELRTKEQLGYIVGSDTREFDTTCGICFLVQSEKSPEYLDARVEAFITKFGETLEEMSETDFEGHKRSLINKRLEKSKNLNQESSRDQAEIESQYCDFGKAEHDVDRIKLLEKSHILKCFRKYLSPASPERARLAVYLYAQGCGQDGNKKIVAPEEASPEQEQSDNNANGKTAVDDAVEIKDVYAYKASLAATPGALPVENLIEFEDTDVKMEHDPIEPA